MAKKKYVSFLSVIFMVLGTTIGAGIFFKNETILDNTGSVIFSFLAWAIAIFAIICICMTLGEIIKKSGWDNSAGYVGWIKTFCGTGLYKGFRNFMFWIFLPANSFILPYYAFMSLQDALSIFFGNKIVLPWYIVSLFSLIIMVYFQYIGVIHKNITIKQNFILTYMKFIPILFVIFGGIFYFALKGSSQNPLLTGSAATPDAPFNLIKFSPIFGVIASIPAIFFAFDGFYAASGVYLNMKEPKKFSSALSIGMSLTALIYLLISIGMLLGIKTGAITGWIDILNTTAGKVLMFVILFCIFLAVLGILNAWTIFIGEFYPNVIKDGGSKLNNWIKSKVNLSDNRKSVILILFFLSSIFLLLTLFGAFYFEGVRTNPYYGEILSKIYGFCDLVADLTALISFIGVGLVILFAVIKKISSSKRYIFFAISAIIVIAISTLFVIVNVTSGLISAIIFQSDNKNTPLNLYLIPSICEFVVALFFLGVCFAPVIIEKCKKNM